MADIAPSHRPSRLTGGLAVLATLVLPLGVLAFPASETVAVIAPAGADAAAIVARAGASVLRLGGRSNVLVVRAGSPDLVARLYASGAWLVIDARFATACTPSSQT